MQLWIEAETLFFLYSRVNHFAHFSYLLLYLCCLCFRLSRLSRWNCSLSITSPSSHDMSEWAELLWRWLSKQETKHRFSSRNTTADEHYISVSGTHLFLLFAFNKISQIYKVPWYCQKRERETGGWPWIFRNTYSRNKFENLEMDFLNKLLHPSLGKVNVKFKNLLAWTRLD